MNRKKERKEKQMKLNDQLTLCSWFRQPLLSFLPTHIEETFTRFQNVSLARKSKMPKSTNFYLMKYAHSNQTVYIKYIKILVATRWIDTRHHGRCSVLGNCVLCERRQWLLISSSSSSSFLSIYSQHFFATTFSGDHLSFSHSGEKSWTHLRIYSWITCIFS